MVPSKQHWEKVYSTRRPEDASWHQEHAERSLRMILETGAPRSARIIDVGAGASDLIASLLREGFGPPQGHLALLDVSHAALEAAKARLKSDAARVQWIEADITDTQGIETAVGMHSFDLWHDRALFHFLVTPAERHAYLRAVTHTLRPDGDLIISTFAQGGPPMCSDRPVACYSAPALAAEFLPDFSLVAHQSEAHRTPWGTEQPFVYCHLRRTSSL